MKPRSFLQGALVGLCISIAALLLFHLLTFVFGVDLVIRGLIAGAAFIYIVYLMLLSGQRIGAVTTMTVWTMTTATLFWLQPSLALYLLSQILFIWLIRSLYFYSSVIASLADLVLSFLGFSAATWASMHTGNIFLSFWCFFLVQALWSAIPLDFKNRRDVIAPSEDRFQEAYRSAQVALSRLSSFHS